MNIKQLPLYVAGLIAAAGIFSTGCTTVVGERIGPIDGIAGQEEATLMAEDKGFLTVEISPSSGDLRGKAVAKKIKTALESEAVNCGFSVAEKSKDVLISFETEVSQFDKSGNYYVFDASVPSITARMMLGSKKLIASGEFESVRGERVLGEEQALNKVANKLAKKAREWMMTGIDMDTIGVKASTIVLRRRGLFKSQDQVYISNYVRNIMAMDGVYSCELIGADDSARIFRVKVVYDKHAFPEGVVNAVMTKLKGKLNLEVAPLSFF